MSIRISTDNKGVKIYRFERNGKITYARRVSKKEGDTWIGKYQRIRFKGSPDIPDGTIVYINYAFDSLDTWVKDGKEHMEIAIVATDYSYDGMQEKPSASYMQMPEPDMPDSFSAAEDEIPF